MTNPTSAPVVRSHIILQYHNLPLILATLPRQERHALTDYVQFHGRQARTGERNRFFDTPTPGQVIPQDAGIQNAPPGL